MRFAVEQWAPEFGATSGPEAMEATEASVDVDAEVPAGEWAPRWPGGATARPAEVAFVDGVRRVEARIWVESARGVHQGLCASYAAGVVRCNGTASVVEAQVDRGVFCDAPDLEPIATRHARFGVRPVPNASAGGDPLPLALQASMADLERTVSLGVPDDCLLVVDGPLRDRASLDHAVGYVKTHHVAYLPEVVADIVPRLAAGQRTPVFLVGDGWRRWSWYLRLPGDRSHGWAGVVRCEASADRTTAEAAALADTCALALPRYASEGHKDPRAPQNVYPIAGLERELKRRLGDPRLLYRALREAGSAVGPAPGPDVLRSSHPPPIDRAL